MKIQMILKINIILLLLSLVSCDSPRDRRAAYKKKETSEDSITLVFENTSSGIAIRDQGTNTSDATTQETSATNNNQNTTVPDDIKHCQWSLDGQTGFTSTHTLLKGGYTICQSSSDSSYIWVQVQYPVNDFQLCFIPTNTSSAGTSIPIGEARCLFPQSSSMIYKIKLFKNRTNQSGTQVYANFTINSIMVMKDNSIQYNSPYNGATPIIDAYFQCISNLEVYQNSAYCNEFKSKGGYISIKF